MTRLLSFAEAAEVAGCHPKTIRKYVRGGEIPVARPGNPTGTAGEKATLVELDELERFLEERRSDHGPECPKSAHPLARGSRCDCALCHCGERHEPGGFLGACLRCHRPRLVNGRVDR